MTEDPAPGSTRDAAAARVLVVGPRRGLLRALDELHVPYVVWTERARSHPQAEHVHVAPVAVGERLARATAESLRAFGPFTHVIAGGESGVVPASVARRVLGARRSSHSTVIRCRDKLRMKSHLHARGIPMTAFVAGDAPLTPAEVVERLGLPVVAKLRAQSGGRGLEIIESAEALAPVLSRRTLLERFVRAPEVSVESFVVGGVIRFESVTEYLRKAHVNVVPAGIDAETRAALLELNRRVVKALDISWGMTHVEFYLAPEGLLFGEIALRPPGGYLMDLIELSWRIDPWRAYASVELDRPFDFSVGAPAQSAVVILHPGAGRVASVKGRRRVREHPAVVSVKVPVREGDLVKERVGVGIDAGHVLIRAATRDELDDAIAFVDEHLTIELETPVEAAGSGGGA